MSDVLNGLIRVRDNVRKEIKRLEGLTNRAGPNFADRYTLGKIDSLKWTEMNMTIEIDFLRDPIKGGK
jgi:hypothetical protein